MDFKQAITSGFNNYVTFSGRAARSEYWYWALFVFLVDLAALFIDRMLSSGNPSAYGLFYGIAVLALFLPNLAVSVRRLHDVDRSGWWLLIAFVPVVGLIVLLIWVCQKGTDGSNRFGADPLGLLKQIVG